MKWKTELWPRALRDYFDILNYLSDFYPSTPRNFDIAFQKAKRRLEDNPYGWSVYYDNPAYRRALIGKYTMLYKIDEGRHEVHIHRLLRGSWDIPRIMRESEDSEEVLEHDE